MLGEIKGAFNAIIDTLSGIRGLKVSAEARTFVLATFELSMVRVALYERLRRERAALAKAKEMRNHITLSSNAIVLLDQLIERLGRMSHRFKYANQIPVSLRVKGKFTCDKTRLFYMECREKVLSDQSISSDELEEICDNISESVDVWISFLKELEEILESNRWLRR